MLSYQKGVVKTSVRHLVEFLFRGGDITTGSSVSASPEAMLEGSRLHRKIQRGQKATYQSEVPLKMEWQEERYDLVLEGRADGIDKTEADLDLDKKIFKANQDLIELEQQYNSENSLQKRLKDFKKALLKNQTLEEFDREIFESIVEKVIIGGYDENGKEDPYKIIFIYKTGFKDEIENAKKRYENTSGRVDGKLCSYITSEVKDLYPCNSDNTHRPC